MTNKVYLYSGQLYITSVPSLLITVLGSCVAVCLWDKKTHQGGMNHFVMPGADTQHAGNADRGYNAIKMLTRALLNRGALPENLEAKIFGGSSAIYTTDFFGVGKENIETARDTLRELGIAIAAADTGGPWGRKIIFNTGTGKVKMRLLSENTKQPE